jgi:RNA recognition motif-containing protein
MAQIIIKNLSDDQNEKYQKELKKLFSKFGTIIDDDYEIDSYNSAIFEYENIKECVIAIDQMNGKSFKGDKILVEFYKFNQQQEIFFDVDYSKSEILELLETLILPSEYIKNLSIILSKYRNFHVELSLNLELNVLLLKKEKSYTLINFDTKKGIIPKNIILEDIDIFICNYINVLDIDNNLYNNILNKYHDVNLFIGKLYQEKYLK